MNTDLINKLADIFGPVGVLIFAFLRREGLAKVMAASGNIVRVAYAHLGRWRSHNLVRYVTHLYLVAIFFQMVSMLIVRQMMPEVSDKYLGIMFPVTAVTILNCWYYREARPVPLPTQDIQKLNAEQFRSRFGRGRSPMSAIVVLMILLTFSALFSAYAGMDWAADAAGVATSDRAYEILRNGIGMRITAMCFIIAAALPILFVLQVVINHYTTNPEMTQLDGLKLYLEVAALPGVRDENSDKYFPKSTGLNQRKYRRFFSFLWHAILSGLLMVGLGLLIFERVGSTLVASLVSLLISIPVGVVVLYLMYLDDGLHDIVELRKLQGTEEEKRIKAKGNRYHRIAESISDFRLAGYLSLIVIAPALIVYKLYKLGIIKEAWYWEHIEPKLTAIWNLPWYILGGFFLLLPLASRAIDGLVGRNELKLNEENSFSWTDRWIAMILKFKSLIVAVVLGIAVVKGIMFFADWRPSSELEHMANQVTDTSSDLAQRGMDKVVQTVDPPPAKKASGVQPTNPSAATPPATDNNTATKSVANESTHALVDSNHHHTSWRKEYGHMLTLLSAFAIALAIFFFGRWLMKEMPGIKIPIGIGMVVAMAWVVFPVFGTRGHPSTTNWFDEDESVADPVPKASIKAAPEPPAPVRRHHVPSHNQGLDDMAAFGQ